MPALAFPDRHLALQSVDRLTAAVERGAAMGGDRVDADAGLADRHPSHGVADSQGDELVPVRDRASEITEGRIGERSGRLVVQRHERAEVGVSFGPRRADEAADRTTPGRGPWLVDERRRFDRRVDPRVGRGHDPDGTGMVGAAGLS